MTTVLLTRKGEPVAVTDRPSALSSLREKGPAVGVLPKAAAEAEGEYPGDARLLELEEDRKRELFSRAEWREAPDFIDERWLETVADRFFGRPVLIAEGERVRLREEVPDDAPAIMRLYADPLTERYVDPLPETEEEVRSMLAAYRHFMYDFYGFGIWGIEEKESGELIGRAGLEPDEEPGYYSLGYLLDASRRGRGLAREAAALVIRFAEEELGIPQKKIRCRTAADNERSVHLAESLGVTVIRMFPEDVTDP